MSKLFIIYLGGSAPNANIEVHDIQFVVADRIEDTYEQLKESWFGDIKGLHLDSYKVIEGADGYRVSLLSEPQASTQALYFVNLGGYQKDQLNEHHEFGLFVANNKTEAKDKAKAALLKDSLLKHNDNLMEVDDCLRISSVNGHYIHLHASDESFDLKPDWYGYNVIGSK